VLSRVAAMDFGLRFCSEVAAIHARASKGTTAESNASRRNAVAGFAGWESRGRAVFAVESVWAVHCGFLLRECQTGDRIGR
jgi:hypothetical protein